MFVFPAFDKNYKQRKRTYKCCRTCRSKRIKCIIKSTNYDVEGCEICKQRDIICDLIKSPSQQSKESSQSNERISPKTQPDVHHIQSSQQSQQPSTVKYNNQIPFGNQSNYPNSVPQMYYSSNYIQNLPSGQSSHPAFIISSPVPPAQIHPMLTTQMTNQTSSSNSTPLSNSSGTTPSNIPHLSPEYQYHYSVYQNMNSNQFNQFGQTNQVSGVPTPPSQGPSPGTKNYIAPITSAQSILLPPPIKFPSLSSPMGPEPERELKKLKPSSVEEPKLESVIESPNPEPKIEFEEINAQFLKEKYDFNASIIDAQYTFTHIPAKDTGRTLLRPTNESYKPFKNPSLKLKVNYEYLKSILAFTLSGPLPFMFSAYQERKLLELYFFKINSVFPIIHESQFWDKYDKGIVSNILVYSMILSIIRDGLSNVKMEFLYHLELKIRQLLIFLPEIGDNDKLTKAQVLILLSLNFGDLKEANEQSSTDLVSAISVTFSLLIHWKLTHEKLKSDGKHERSMALKKLWFTLFIFDRFNGITNSKAFFIKEKDFDIECDTDDDEFNKLVSNVRMITEAIVIIYQPSKNDPSRMPELVSAALRQINMLVRPPLIKLTKLDEEELIGYKKITFYSLNTLILKIMLLAVNAAKMHTQGKLHEISDTSMGLCLDIASLFEYLVPGTNSDDENARDFQVENDSLVLQIPVIPCFFCVYMSVSIKYKIKSIYFIKLGKLNQRDDLKDKLETIDLIFDKFNRNAKIFTKWAFMNDIYDNFNYFINKIEKTMKVKTNMKFKQSGEIKRNSKTRISSLISDVAPIVSLSSPSYYSIENLEKSMIDEEMKRRSLNEEDLNESKDEIDFDFDHDLSELLNTENNALLQGINNEFLHNLSDFVTQDPLLKDFFELNET